MFQVLVGNYVSRWACLKYSRDFLWWVIVAIVCGVGGGIILVLAIIISVVIARRRNRRPIDRRSGRVLENRMKDVGRETVIKVGRQNNGKEDKRYNMVTKKVLSGPRKGGYKRDNADGNARPSGHTYTKDIDFNRGGYSKSTGRNDGEYSTDIELQEGSYSRHPERDTRAYGKRIDSSESVYNIDTMNGEDRNPRYLKVRAEGNSRHVGQPPGDIDHDSDADFDTPDYSDDSGSDKEKTLETNEPTYFRNIGASDTFYTKRISSILQTKDEPDKHSDDANYLQARDDAKEYSRNIQPDRFDNHSDSFVGPNKFFSDSVSDNYPIFEHDTHRLVHKSKTNSPKKAETEKGLPADQLISMPYGRQHLTRNFRGNVPGMPRLSNYGGFHGLHAISLPSNGNDRLDPTKKLEDVSQTNETNSLQKTPNRLALAFQKMFQGHARTKKNDDSQ